MTEHSVEKMEAAREAAQKAVETATSWDYSAGETKVADKLREGLDAAGVTKRKQSRSKYGAKRPKK